MCWFHFVFFCLVASVLHLGLLAAVLRGFLCFPNYGVTLLLTHTNADSRAVWLCGKKRRQARGVCHGVALRVTKQLAPLLCVTVRQNKLPQK